MTLQDQVHRMLMERTGCSIAQADAAVRATKPKRNAPLFKTAEAWYKAAKAHVLENANKD